MDTIRYSYIAELERAFKPFTDALYKELQAQHFNFAEQKSAHLLHLDPVQIVRHSLPYCITQDIYFSLKNSDVTFFAAVILLHSLALTRIDDYYDGGKIEDDKPLNVETLAYSVSATYEATLTLLRRSPNAAELANMLDVTNFVHARMYKDYTERYRLEYLEAPLRRIDAYLHSPRSRLMGSGYWEVMARAAFVQKGREFPAYLHSIDVKLRKFRQIIDELADIEEDVRGGLVTLPILHALSKRPEHTRQSILNYWQSSQPSREATTLPNILRELKTDKWIYAQAMPLYWDAMKEIDVSLGKRGSGYKKLFDYKRAKLEALIQT